MITLLVITDGRRDYLDRTLQSFKLSVTQAPIGRRIIVNDCPANAAHEAWIDTLGFDVHVRPEAHRRGFAGAIAAGWAALAEDTELVFHLEDDFLFTRHVDLVAMTRILRSNPHLVQMALRRQPWNEQEIAAGGIVEQHPEAYADCDDCTYYWLEHNVFFTTNPSLYPAWITRLGWPQADNSEGRFGIQLFQQAGLRSAFWGRRSDEPWVLHIGADRSGSGY